MIRIARNSAGLPDEFEDYAVTVRLGTPDPGLVRHTPTGDILTREQALARLRPCYDHSAIVRAMLSTEKT